MRLLRAFARAYPYRTGIMLACLLLGSVAEGLGLSALLPLLAIAVHGDATATHTVPLGAAVVSALQAIGLSPSGEVLLTIIIAGAVLKAVLILIANQQVGYTVAHIATDLRLSLIRALLRTRWEYYVHAPLGAFANAVAAEATRASDAYLRSTTVLMLSLQIAVYAAVAALVSWPATAVAVLGGLVVAAALHRLIRTARRAGARQTRLAKALLTQLLDTLQAVKPLKAMAREHLLEPLLEDETQRLNQALELEVRSKAAMRALQEPLIVVAVASGVFGAFQILALPLGTIIMLTLLAVRILDGVMRAQREWQQLASCESAYDAMIEMTRHAEAMREPQPGGIHPTLAQEIRLSGAHFAYGERPVLRNASLVVRAGQITAIVGPSGAGKTTIADLVAGLIRLQSGQVLIDHVSIDAVDIAAWRAMIGYVPQETLLMHDSVAANVTLGDPRLTAADVDAALRAAGAHEFVAAMPEGAATLVGERGLRLSGGQRQRIALARALVHRPALLILDEATSALDPETEAGICETFRQLRGQVTILAVCHQGPLIELADRVYQVEDGAALPVLRPSSLSTAAGP